MSVLLSRTTGNFTTNTTWGLIDSTSYNNTETTTTALTTSYAASASSTTGAITVDGIALKLSVRTGTTGTMSVHLAIATVEVTGTLVTINTADLPVAATADLNGGWHFFKFASPVTLLEATSYTVEAKTSSSSQISLFSTATTNWARALVTTTNQAPAAGDDLIICGEYTGAGTSNTFTVTMGSTAATDYGSNTTSTVTPSLAICNKGILTYGATAATNYVLRQSGHVIIYSGGIFNIGTTETPIPRDSTAVLEFDCTSDGSFGFVNRNLGTFNAQGLSRTSGKNVVQCLLNTDEAAAQTVLGVDTDTGWLNTDDIIIASTTRTTSQWEKRTLSSSSSSTLTVTAGLTNAHSGTSPTQAEVGLLTRNVKIRSATSTLATYMQTDATSTSDIDWVEFRYLGTSIGSKYGILCNITTGSLTLDYCSIYDGEYVGVFVNAQATTGTIAITNTIIHAISQYGLYLASAGTGQTNNTSVIDCLLNGCSIGIYIGSYGWKTLLRVTCTGCTSQAFYFTGITAPTIFPVNASYTYLTGHSCGGSALYFTSYNGMGQTISNIKGWRNNSPGIDIAGGVGNVVISTASLFGCTTYNMRFTSGANCTFNNFTSSGDTTFSTTSGINIAGGSGTVVSSVTFNSLNSGTVSGIYTAHTQDIYAEYGNALGINFLFNNPVLASATEVNVTGGLPMPYSLATMNPPITGSVRIMNKDNVSGAHYTHLRGGVLSLDTTVYNTASPSLRMTPSSATIHLISEFNKAAVASGGTITCAVYINKNASYNGEQPKLYVKRNEAAGITADTVLATYSAGTGSWNQISGTTAAVSQDAVLEFYVTCTGTAGYISVDDWSVS